MFELLPPLVADELSFEDRMAVLEALRTSPALRQELERWQHLFLLLGRDSRWLLSGANVVVVASGMVMSWASRIVCRGCLECGHDPRASPAQRPNREARTHNLCVLVRPPGHRLAHVY